MIVGPYSQGVALGYPIAPRWGFPPPHSGLSLRAPTEGQVFGQPAEFLDALKFAELLPEDLRLLVASARLIDREALKIVLSCTVVSSFDPGASGGAP